MNILNLFTAHKVVEINLSTGLRTGHMLAQHAYKNDKDKFVDNGNFFRMSKAATDEVVLADDVNAVGPYFLHYTEELETTGLVSALKYFTDEIVDGVCYPRCIALYAGDTFTTDNVIAPVEGAKFATVGANGVLELSASYPTAAYEGPVFQVVACKMPDNETDGYQFTVIDPMAKIA